MVSLRNSSSHPPVKRFADAVLHWLARRDEMPGHARRLRPGQHGVARELRAVVGNDHSRLAAMADDVLQFARHAPTRDRGVGDRAEAFLGHVVDYVQHPEPSSRAELVMHKVERPARIWQRLDVPDIEFVFRGLPGHAGMWFPGIRKAYLDGFGIRPCLLHPESRGEATLFSSRKRIPRTLNNFRSGPKQSGYQLFEIFPGQRR